MTSVLILVIGYGSGSKFMRLRNDGAFDRWEDFSSPVKAEKIVEATSQKVWIQSSEGAIYEGDVYCEQNSGCAQWQEVSMVPSDLHEAGELDLKKNQDCQFGEFPSMRKVPGTTIECVRAEFAGPEYGHTHYYALLENGALATWAHSGSMIEDIWLTICIGAIIVVIWVMAFLLLDFRARKATKVLNQSNTG